MTPFLKDRFMQKPLLLLLTALTIMFSACKDVTEDYPLELGVEYFPLEVGKWLVYEADSVIYNGFTGYVDTVNFFIRENVESEFTDNEGRQAYRIERSYRQNENEDWQLKDIWYAVNDSQYAERVEENVRFLKLVFPITLNKTWKGNTYIDVNDSDLSYFADWDYQITNTNSTYQFGNINISNTVDVLQNDFETFIEKSYAKETYAKGVGLVFKELWQLETQDLGNPVPWPNKAEEGFTYRQRLIEHN